MSQAVWYVSRGKDRRGPFSEDDIHRHLSQGDLTPDDKIWREGMSSWVPIRNVLSTPNSTGAPPPPSVGNQNGAVTGLAGEGSEKPRKWFFQTWFIVLLLFTISPVGIVLMWLQKPRSRFFGKVGACVVITILFGTGWTVGIVKSCAGTGNPQKPLLQELHFGNVECQPALAGYQCTLTHVQGSHPINMCWKLNVTCANGLATTSLACGDVSPLGRSTVLVPFAQIPQWEKCDTVTALSLTDMKVTVR